MNLAEQHEALAPSVGPDAARLKDWRKHVVEQQVAYLRKRGMMPRVDVEPYLGESVRGEFEAGAGPTGTIRLSKEELNPGTLAHELNHAADSQIIGQYYDNKNYADPQFANAYQKLYFRDSRPDYVKRFPGGKEFMKESQYRGSQGEMGSWGVGNMLSPGVQWSAPPHVDASLATETQVLMELANRKAGLSRYSPEVKAAESAAAALRKK